MAENIKIHPNDDTFSRLLKMAVKGLRGDKKLLKKAKKEFAESDIQLYYNKDTETVRVLKKDAPPVDFPVANFAIEPTATSKKAEK